MHYSRAPIAEAVIDLHVTFDAMPAVGALERFAKTLVVDFPQQQRINALEMALKAAGEDGSMSSNTSTSTLGFRLTNQIGDRVLQIRRNGLSYSHLAPYTEWDSFVAEMRPLWSKFLADLAPKAVSRFAVRYINRITVPQGADLDEYLNLTPRLLEGICPDVEGYFLQLVLPQKDLGPEWKAIVNTALEGAVPPNAMSVLLDIDLFCEQNIGVGEGDVWPVLDQLRHRKNLIFEAAITDKVRSMIE